MKAIELSVDIRGSFSEHFCLVRTSNFFCDSVSFEQFIIIITIYFYDFINPGYPLDIIQFVLIPIVEF